MHQICITLYVNLLCSYWAYFWANMDEGCPSTKIPSPFNNGIYVRLLFSLSKGVSVKHGRIGSKDKTPQ